MKKKLTIFLGAIIIFSVFSAVKVEASTYVGVSDLYGSRSWNYEPYTPTIAWAISSQTWAPPAPNSSNQNSVSLYYGPSLSALIDATVDCGNGQTHRLYTNITLSETTWQGSYSYGAFYYSSPYSFIDSSCGAYYKSATYSATGTVTITGGGQNYSGGVLNVVLPVNNSVNLQVLTLDGGIVMMSQLTGGTTYGATMGKAPLTVDLSAAGYYMTPSSSSYIPSSAKLNFDCTNDGTYELKNVDTGYYGGIYTARGVCAYTNPGLYTAAVKGQYLVGGASYTPMGYIQSNDWRDDGSAVANILVLPKDSLAITTTPAEGEITVAAGDSVQYKTDVNNFLYSTIDYSIECDGVNTNPGGLNSGGPVSYSNETAASFTTTDVSYSHACVYKTPGQYTAKVTIKLTPAKYWLSSNQISKSSYYGDNSISVNRTSDMWAFGYSLMGNNPDIPGQTTTFTKTINVTGEVSDNSSANSSIVTSPFDLKWDTSTATSCSIVGVGNNSFSHTGSGTGSTSVSKAPGNYQYKLTCSNSAGSGDSKILNVKVVPN